MIEINKDFWKGKRVLVTGAAGFIGSHLCEKLVKAGCNVRAFIRYNSSNSWGLLELLPENVINDIEIVTGDILDEESIGKATKSEEIIFHLAALPGIPYSMSNPRHVFLVNTFGSFNLLSAARDSGAERIIMTSSAGASEKRPILSPYIMSKSAMERVGQGFNQGLGIDVRTIRLMNNYGPGQSARAVIPTIISQALKRDDVHLGSVEPRMDFNYVGDTVLALMRTAEISDKSGNVLTWGTGVTVSIREMAEQIFSIIGRNGLHIVTDKERVRPNKGAVASLEEDIKATHSFLRINPVTPLRDGLRITIDWISQHMVHYKDDKYAV